MHNREEIKQYLIKEIAQVKHDLDNEHRRKNRIPIVGLLTAFLLIAFAGIAIQRVEIHQLASDVDATNQLLDNIESVDFYPAAKIPEPCEGLIIQIGRYVTCNSDPI